MISIDLTFTFISSRVNLSREIIFHPFVTSRKTSLKLPLFLAHDLAGSEAGGFNDPYVRLELSPAVDNRKRQTSIHRNNNNPYFDEHFKFPVSHEDLQDKTLVLQVRDFAMFERNFLEK